MHFALNWQTARLFRSQKKQNANERYKSKRCYSSTTVYRKLDFPVDVTADENWNDVGKDLMTDDF